MKNQPQLKQTRLLKPAFCAGVMLAATFLNTNAAVRTWTGGGATFNWTDNANWGGNQLVQGDDIVFTGSVGLLNTNDLPANTWFNSVTFDASAGAFTLEGNLMRIGNNNGNKGYTNASPNVQFINIETKNDRQVNYDTTGASMIFTKGPWDQRFSKSGPNDLVCLQRINQLNGQVTGITGGRLILAGETNGVIGHGLQINPGGTAIIAGIGAAKGQIEDADNRADVTMSGGLLQVQNTNALGAASFELVPMFRGAAFDAIVENGSAVGPVQLRIGGGTAARVGAFDGIIRDGSGGGALSIMLVNASGATFWRLGGTNTYSGDTVLTNGATSGFTRLIVNGQNIGGSKYVVQGSTPSSPAVLAGAGIISASSVEVNANGVIAPGGVLNGGSALYNRQGGASNSGSGIANTGTFAESTAVLTITNNVNLNDATSSLDLRLNGTNSGTFDKLVIAGSGVFSNNNANLQLTLEIGFFPNPGDKFTLVEVPGTAAANNVGTFATLNGTATSLAQGASFFLSGIPFKISYRAEGNTFDAGAGNGNDIMIEVQPDTSTRLTWRGDLGSDWDVAGLANWRTTNNTPATFANLDKVTFDDSGLVTNINLTTDLTPLTLTVSATKDYFFAGAGKFTGPVYITKTNTGRMVITTDNDFAGATTIQDGTVQIGDGGGAGHLPGAVVLATTNGILEYNLSVDRDLGQLSGTGKLVHSGTGQLAVTNDLSAFTGTVSNLAGTFKIGTGVAAGNNSKLGGMVDVAAGSTLYHTYNGATDFTVNNSMRGAGACIFEFATGGPKSLTFGGSVNNNGFTGTTTVKPFMRLNVATAASAPGGPIVVESIGSPGHASYYSHPGANVTNFNSITIAGTGPGTGVDGPRGKGALRLGNVWVGPVILSGNATIGADGTGTIRGNITDNAGNFVLEYLGGITQVGPSTGINTYGETQINEDYSGSFNSPLLTTVRALNGTPFGQGVVSMKGRARLELNGNNVAIPNLVDTSLVDGGGSFAPEVANNSSSAAATLTVGSDDGSQTFIGTFINGSTRPLGLTKVGTGVLTLSGNSTATGTVSVNAGTLALVASTFAYTNGQPVVGSGSFSNAALLTVASGATLDVIGRTDGTLTVNNGQTLGGSGTVNGKVVVASGGNLAPGSSIGQLTVSGDVTLGGSLTIEVNRTASPNTDKLASSGGVITGGGSLIITNTGAPLQIGDTFQVFAVGVSGITVPAQTVDYVNALTYTWNNNLAGSGSVSVASVTAITAPTLNVSQAGNSLGFSWTGPFKLQSQTNSLNVGVSSNWFNYPGGSTSPVNVTINPTNPTVFFRLSLQ